MIKTINVFSTVVPRLFTRQTDKTQLIFDNYRFRFNSTAKCDFLLIFDDIPNPINLITPPKFSILFTTEPQEIKQYHSEYLRQYDLVVTSQDNLKHDYVINQQTALPWMIGIYQKSVKEKLPNSPADFKEFKYPQKQISITAIVSSKTKTSDHKQRLRLVTSLKSQLGNQMQLFGKGIRQIPDKWLAIAPYQYQLVIENSRHNDYWTEKLADAFLGETYPLYWGAPNISKYFSKESLIPINIYDIDGTLGIIRECLKNNTFNKKYSQIKKAKLQIIEEYNFFRTVINVIGLIPLNYKSIKTTHFQPNQEFFLNYKIVKHVSKFKNSLLAFQTKT
jgi:hypothetical protein